MDSCTIMTPDGRNYPLARGRTKPLVVGREKGVAIRIYQGAGVSPQHASFSWPADREVPLVTDMGGGVSVNGREVLVQQSLRHGALVEVGDVVLTVTISGAAADEQPEQDMLTVASKLFGVSEQRVQRMVAAPRPHEA